MKLNNDLITLRPLGMPDAEEFQMGANDKSIARNLFMPHPFKMKDACQSIVKSQRGRLAGNTYAFGIIDNKSDRLVGIAGLYHVNKSLNSAELAYWVNRKFRGRGYATAAARLTAQYAFTTLKLRKITAGTMADNPVSAKVLIRVGFKKEAQMRKHIKLSGKWIDISYFGLFKEEVA